MDVVDPLLVQGSMFAYDGYLGQCDDLGYAGFEAQAREASPGIWQVPGGAGTSLGSVRGVRW